MMSWDDDTDSNLLLRYQQNDPRRSEAELK